MKNETYNSLGHKFNIAVPETVDEFDALAKVPGAALKAANTQEVYHGTLGDIRDAFVAAVAKETGIQPREIGTGTFEDGPVDPVTNLPTKIEITKSEKLEVYLNRVAAEKGLTGDAPFQSIADTLSAGGAAEVKFDPSVRERKAPKSPIVPKWATEGATKFLATATDTQKASFVIAATAAGFAVVITGDSVADIQSFAKGAVAIKNATPVFVTA